MELSRFESLQTRPVLIVFRYGHCHIIFVLHARPKVGTAAENVLYTQGYVRSDAPFAVDNLRYRQSGHLQQFRNLAYFKIIRLYYLFQEYPAGMYVRACYVFPFRFLHF